MEKAGCSRFHKFDGLGPQELLSKSDVHNSFVGGAIAELVDNAREAKTSRLRISRNRHFRALYFCDNGEGMDPERLAQMFNFGATSKVDPAGDQNNYGAGFKSGTMAIGDQALVLTTNGFGRGLAFLSKSLNANSQKLRVPFVWWHPNGDVATEQNPIMKTKDLIKHYKGQKCSHRPLQRTEESEKLLSTLYEANGTPIGSFEALREEFDALQNFIQKHKNENVERDSGTRVIVFRMESSGPQSLCLPGDLGACEENAHDIIINSGSELPFTRKDRNPPFLRGVDVPIDYSLRRYLEVLYTPDTKMTIDLLGKTVRYIDLLDEHFVVTKKTYDFELPKLSNDDFDDDTVDMEVTFCLSPDDFENRRWGLFVYWSTEQFKTANNGQEAPRLILPYHRVGEQENVKGAAAVSGADFRGIIGVVTITPKALRIHNGKQGFHQLNKVHGFKNTALNYNKCMELLDELFQKYMTEASQENDRFLMLWEEMAQERLVWGLPCWAKFEKVWWPSKLLNRFDRQIAPENLALRDDEGAENLEAQLVQYLNEDPSQCYGFPRRAQLKAWGSDPNNLKDRKPTEKYVGAVQEAKELAKELLEGEADHLVECPVCKQVRRYRGAEYTGAYQCSLGWHPPRSLRRETRCDREAFPEDPNERRQFMEETSTNPSEKQGLSAARSEMIHPGPGKNIEELDITGLKAEQDAFLLARGDQAELWVVTWKGEQYVAKFFDVSGDVDQQRKSFEKELRGLEMLSSCKHVVNVRGKQTTEQRFAVLMDQCDFNMEAAILDERIPYYDRVKMALQVCTGMERANQLEEPLVHADLKLQNILVKLGAEDGYRAIVADFAMSKVLSKATPTASLTTPHNLFTAPEIFKHAPPSQKSDVYSFGWILAQMVAEKVTKWKDESFPSVWAKIHNGETDTDLLEIVRSKCEELARLVHACWSKSPDARPTFAALTEALGNILKKTPTSAGQSLEKFKSRHKSSKVWRVLDDLHIEDYQNGHGLRAADPHNRVQAGVEIGHMKTLNEHVQAGQSSHSRSGMISCSLSKEWIYWYVQKKAWMHGNLDKNGNPQLPRSKNYKFYPWVEIDLDYIDEKKIKVIDISSKFLISECKDARGLAVMAQNFAAAAKEVIIIGDIPQKAIVQKFEIDPTGRHGKSFMSTGQELQHDIAKWKPVRKNQKFEPYEKWRDQFRTQRHGDNLDSFWKECADTGNANPTWPVPAGHESRNANLAAGKKKHRGSDRDGSGKVKQPTLVAHSRGENSGGGTKRSGDHLHSPRHEPEGNGEAGPSSSKTQKSGHKDNRSTASPHVLQKPVANAQRKPQDKLPYAAQTDQQKLELGLEVRVASKGKTIELIKNGAEDGSGTFRDTYFCSCDVWKNSGLEKHRRTCQHLQDLRGEKTEMSRVGQDAWADFMRGRRAMR